MHQSPTKWVKNKLLNQRVFVLQTVFLKYNSYKVKYDFAFFIQCKINTNKFLKVIIRTKMSDNMLYKRTRNLIYPTQVHHCYIGFQI